jgi:hypothetical protein
MIWLDVLPYNPDRVHRVVKPVIKTVQDSLDTIRDTIGSTKDAVVDSAAQSQLILDNSGAAQSEASLLLPIAIVALALAGCLYLAHVYRRRKAAV